jgi:hypothetical protein
VVEYVEYCPSCKCFDEQALRSDIIKQWGPAGAHIDVFDDLLARVPGEGFREFQAAQLVEAETNRSIDASGIIQPSSDKHWRDYFEARAHDLSMALICSQNEARELREKCGKMEKALRDIIQQSKQRSTWGISLDNIECHAAYALKALNGHEESSNKETDK